MIAKDIHYIGVNDHDVDLFEGQYPVPNGMAYNSYIILDEKVAVLDTVDRRFGDEWLGNIKAVVGDRAPDYLIVHHMEPDHSANIARLLEVYPDATVVASLKAFDMMKKFFGSAFSANKLIVGEGDTLSLGEHALSFITAPMVHWPEVLLSYDSATGVLFSADAFGKFGALDCDEEWLDEARRYYIGIVGKYGMQVQSLLKKAAGLEIKKICSLHGPVLNNNLDFYLEKYKTWSSYQPEENGVTIAYASIYGNTKDAALLLADELSKSGVKHAIYDLARCDITSAVADAFRFDRLVLASSTYNADVFPFMKTFIDHLTERNFSSRTVALIENGTWAPMAAKVMRSRLEGAKNITYTEGTVRINSALDDVTRREIAALADELAK